MVEGFIIGLHKSPFHGFSVEFAEHRLYNPGESTRNIDWKVFARTERLFTKKYEEETNLRCQVVVDTSSSMNFPLKNGREGQQLNKLEFSALAAASLMNFATAPARCLWPQSGRYRIECPYKSKSSTTHYRLLLSYLDQIIGAEQAARQTSAASAIHQIADTIHRRSLVMLFTDMFDASHDLESLFTAIQHLKYNKHEVIIFQVIDKTLELGFDFDNRPYHFVDIETREEIKVQSNLIRDGYIKKINDFQEEIRHRCLQYRIDYQIIDIHADLFKVLQSYLVKRSKMST